MLAVTTAILQLLTRYKDSFMPQFSQINSPLSPSHPLPAILTLFPPHSPSWIFRFIMSTSNIWLVKQRQKQSKWRKKRSVSQSLDVWSAAGAPISRFEVFWQPIMHLEVIWCEAEELGWGGCGMWVRISEGECVFREMLMRFSILCVCAWQLGCGACFCITRPPQYGDACTQARHNNGFVLA